ncbi:type II toxin-antitoxin system HipA family toxin [Microlunatus flavus]|uniref:Serine/threonine-protein kinase HipA n=1 Tax=Microlunatus flavus TaxID=1036181 RepID=A0A1H9IYH1_9ACTN|nr:type II toxin-antitoxin system HipA family toxin [Microlunatus flavus]SEQ79569.1 serine/threonine-protein kinase HipA [Microlunatus flavus]
MTSVPASRLRVAVDVDGVATPAATAHVSERRGVVSTTLTYEPGWTRSRAAYALSPELALVASRHHVDGLPGAFADSAPDRWGRNLVAKRLRTQARLAQQAPPTIREVDYLLGVADQTRQGALRFSVEEGGPYLDVSADVPRLVALPRLLRAADAVADDGTDDLAAVKELLAAGSGSLGGARPKASVRAGDRLLIAKFPHAGDQWDVMAWEKTALDLAQACGIEVPTARLVGVGRRRALLLDRFDRRGPARLGYISAMTLLRSADGVSVDYLELAEAMAEHGAAVAADLARLWRRVAFMLVINNVDDHMRNHGFLRASSGWTLSPAFDLNPDPDAGAGRVTTVNFADDAEGALRELVAGARQFRLSAAAASAVLDEVLAATRSWRRTARANGVGEGEIHRFAPALDRFHR